MPQTGMTESSRDPAVAEGAMTEYSPVPKVPEAFMTDASRVPREPEADMTESSRFSRVVKAKHKLSSRVPRAWNHEMTSTHWYWYSDDLRNLARGDQQRRTRGNLLHWRGAFP